MAVTPSKRAQRREKIATALRVNDKITEPATIVGSAFGPIGTAVGKAIQTVGNVGGRVADRIDPGGSIDPDVKGAGNAPATSSGSRQPVGGMGNRTGLGGGVAFKAPGLVQTGSVAVGQRPRPGASVPVPAAQAAPQAAPGGAGMGLAALGALALAALALR